jgi:hypothetical protein
VLYERYGGLIYAMGKKWLGATPPADARPDLEVPDLESLVHALGLRGS